MRRLSIGIAAVVTFAAMRPVPSLAQVLWQSQGPAVAGYPGGYPPQQSPSAGYPGAYQPYPFQAPTPEDAYRERLINRWQLEQYEGPTPQALQGPSPNGGFDTGR
jgi:hypothetical protein